LRANGSRERAPDDRLREAIHELQRERMDCFVASLLAMTSRYRLAFPRPDTPELCKNHSPKTEGAGKAGCPLHPQPRVRNKKHTSVVTTGSPETPSFPCAMVLTACFVLSPVTGLSCHRRLAETPAKLDASVGASGPHDFAVRISIIRPRAIRAPDAAASTASRALRP